MLDKYDILVLRNGVLLLCGEEHRTRKYTGEFKQIVVETMMREKLGYREAAMKYQTTKILQNWNGTTCQKARKAYISNVEAVAQKADQLTFLKRYRRRSAG